MMSKKYRSFEASRKYVRGLKIKREKPEWREYCKSGEKPDDIPRSPDYVYRNKWQGWGDFLGNGATRRKNCWPFLQARAFARKLNLKNQREWRRYCKEGNKPNSLPANPREVYKEFTSLADWLGTDNIANSKKHFFPYQQARAIVRSNGLNSIKEFHQWSKPKGIPSAPNRTYESEWTGWSDWLGVEIIATYNKSFLDFNAARKFARNLNLNSQADWKGYCQTGERPIFIPANPHKTYRHEGWSGYGDWLGNDNIAKHQIRYRSFKLARSLVRKLNLQSQREWKYYCRSGKKPRDIPASPDKTYRDEGWAGYGDWLGSGNVRTKKRTPEEVKELFAAQGFSISFDEIQNNYRSSKSKLSCQCSFGHKVKVNCDGLIDAKRNKTKSKGCPECFSAMRKEGELKRQVTLERLLKDLKEQVLPKFDGKLPSYSELKKTDFKLDYVIHDAIARSGGYYAIRSALGLPNLRRPNRFWGEWKNVVEELNHLFTLDGYFPTHAEFRAKGISIDRICRLHKLTLNQMAEAFGCRLVNKFRCRDGHIVDSLYEAVVDEYMFSRRIPHSIQPKIKEYRADFEIENRIIEIWGYRATDTKSKIGRLYNNKRRTKVQLYKSLGLELIEIEGPELLHDPLVNFVDVENELDFLFKELGYSTKPFFAFTPEIVSSTGFVWSDQLVIDEILCAKQELQRFPQLSDFHALGRSRVASAISRFGGIKRFKRIIKNLDTSY